MLNFVPVNSNSNVVISVNSSFLLYISWSLDVTTFAFSCSYLNVLLNVEIITGPTIRFSVVAHTSFELLKLFVCAIRVLKSDKNKPYFKHICLQWQCHCTIFFLCLSIAFEWHKAMKIVPIPSQHTQSAAWESCSWRTTNKKSVRSHSLTLFVTCCSSKLTGKSHFSAGTHTHTHSLCLYA